MNREETIARIRRLQRIENIKRLQSEQEKPEQMGSVESGARGVASGLVPFSNQIQGAAGAAHHVASMKGSEGLLNDYRSSRDSAIEKERRAQKENPAAFYPGLVAGAYAQKFVPVLNALGPIASGTMHALGASDADLTKGEFGQAAKDTALGGSIGAAFKHAPGAFGWAANKIGKRAETFANDRALKTAMGSKISGFRAQSGTTLKHANPITAKKRLDNAGKIIREEKILGPFSKSGEKGEQFEHARKRSWDEVSKVGKELDSTLPDAIETKKIAEELRQYASSLPRNLESKKLVSKLNKEADNFESMGNVGFFEAQKLKNSFPHSPFSPNPMYSNKANSNKIKSIISNEMEKSVGRNSGNESLGKLLAAKEKYGVFKNAATANGDELNAERARRWFSPSDTAALLAGAVGTTIAGHPAPAMVGLGVGLGHKIARERGSAFSAYTAGKIADLLQQKPEFARKFGSLLSNAMQRGPAAVTATHAVLMKNPSYRQEFEQESGDENLSNTEGRPQGVEE